MLEIVYDLAPSASPLLCHGRMTAPANLASNIIALKNAGCKVIVDDVTYINESPFQDDIISQAVNTVTAAGVLYFSSAANSGNEHSGIPPAPGKAIMWTAVRAWAIFDVPFTCLRHRSGT